MGGGGSLSCRRSCGESAPPPPPTHTQTSEFSPCNDSLMIKVQHKGHLESYYTQNVHL